MSRKGPPNLALLALALVCTLLAAVPALAQDSGFADSFDDPALPGWERSDGVLVVDGVLRITPGSMAFRLGQWDRPSIRLALRYTAPGEAVIRYHATDSGAYSLHLAGESIWLDRLDEGTPTNLGRVDNAPVASGEWMEVLITSDGQQHQISLNQEVVLTVEDGEPLAPGAIGLTLTGDNLAEVDDLVVTMPPAGQPQPGAAPAGFDWEGLVNEFLVPSANLPDLRTFLINLGLAAVLASILGLVYIHWGASLSNRRKFAGTFTLIALTTTFIILVVRSSVALSLGLVGALSIVRFRAAIKEPEELAYLFVCIALGIGLGDNQRLITILAFAAMVAIVGLMKALGRPHADANLHLTVASRNPQELDPEQIMQALALHCPKIKLLRLDESKDAQELSFLVEFCDISDLHAARAAIRSLSGSAEITFLDNRGIW